MNDEIYSIFFTAEKSLAWTYLSVVSKEHRSELEFCSRQGVHPEQQPKSLLPSFKIHPAISPSTDSAQALEWARLRLDKCKEHDICEQACADIAMEDPTGPRYPSRLLNIEEVISTAPTGAIVKLHEEFPASTSYVCLSYCWGQTQHFVLDDNSHALLLQGLPIDGLPRTLREAMVFARKLGYQWIWIDALCIRQDQVSESTSEIKNMAEVYAKGALTLAIVKSRNTDEGCFSEPYPDHAGLAVDVDLSAVCSSESGASDINLRRRLQHLMTSASWTWREGKEDAKLHPLMSRAWAFQEFFQSVRLLIFASNELIWRCLREERCECSEDNIDTHDAFRTGIRLEDLDTRAIKQKWYEVVSAYSRRQITFSSDRERAIVSLGRRFEAAAKDLLIAGTWMAPNDMRMSLYWSLLGPVTGASQRAKQWPSWSWLSVVPREGTESLIYMSLKQSKGQLDDSFETRLEIIKCSSIEDLKQEQSEYCLKATTKLIPAKIGAYLWDGPELELLLSGGWPRHTAFSPDYESSYPAMSGMLSLLPLADHGDGRLQCLVLAPVTDRTRLFERVGTALIDDLELLCYPYQPLDLRAILII
jgi:hypothetical protein